MKNWIDDFAGKCLTIIGLVILGFVVALAFAMELFVDTMTFLTDKVLGRKTTVKSCYAKPIRIVEKYVKFVKLFLAKGIDPMDILNEVYKTDDALSVLNKYGL